MTDRYISVKALVYQSVHVSQLVIYQAALAGY